MALMAKRVDMWAAGIEDKPGGLAAKLWALAEAGATLEFVLARRAPDKPGKGVVFLSPIKGAKQIRAAKKAGIRKTRFMNAVRVEGRDKPGLGGKITQALAEKGVNLRGLSAVVIGKRFVLYMALDTTADATRAVRVLNAMR